MKEQLQILELEGLKISIREETTDFNCVKEVIKDKCYRRVTPSFDVEEGEYWLDLGGNIGAFGLYVMNKGGFVQSFEPDKDCFKMMKNNYKNNFSKELFEVNNFAISNSNEEEIVFYRGASKGDRYRTSLIPNKRGEKIALKNKNIDFLKDEVYSGIKMDIEGAEFDILDNDKLPHCEKLVMEYHLTKDKSMINFHKRMDKLKKIFNTVIYPKSLDRGYPNDIYPGFFDRIIYCKDRKK